MSNTPENRDCPGFHWHQPLPFDFLPLYLFNPVLATFRLAPPIDQSIQAQSSILNARHAPSPLQTARYQNTLSGGVYSRIALSNAWHRAKRRQLQRTKAERAGGEEDKQTARRRLIVMEPRWTNRDRGVWASLRAYLARDFFRGFNNRVGQIAFIIFVPPMAPKLK